MGLIREIQGVNATINKQERAKRERERLKILQENYKKELESDLKAEFFGLFNRHDSGSAYKIAVLQKDDIIEKIYKIISKITYTENGKKYLTYSNFDIVGDLDESYYKILTKVKNEIQLSEKIREGELLNALERKMNQLFELSNNKHCASIVAKRHDMIEKIISAVANNETDRAYLRNNYSKILRRVLYSYSGNIELEKIELKNKKQNAMIKQGQKISNQLIFGHILGTINGIIPRGFKNGRGRF